ncbi:hypothetical protein [Nocardia nova]|uniref:hypothetical protein n=1 Tax=Nocardia nova TaxID=37330 RepID=UPI002738A84E|nr:hypothetical protein [Nocardia nova]
MPYTAPDATGRRFPMTYSAGHAAGWDAANYGDAYNGWLLDEYDEHYPDGGQSSHYTGEQASDYAAGHEARISPVLHRGSAGIGP